MEDKELIVRKKNYGYHILAIVFIFSLIGSIIYFSNANKVDNEINNANKNENKIISFIGEKSGEIIFSSESAIKKDKIEKINTPIKENDNKSNELIDDDAILEKTKQEETKQEEIENRDVERSQIQLINIPKEDNVNYYAFNRKLDKNKPMVALTFDDGPDPKRTPEIIEVLKKYNARASFFDIGNLMEKNPETLEKEVKSGCDVGGHTYSHVDLNKLSKEEINEEIKKLEDVFRNVTNQEIKYIRPTYGNANSLVRETVKHPLINWCVDSLEWKTRDTDKILDEIYKTKDFDGKIIIMHAIYDATVEAVKKLVPDLIEKGYELVTISEMAEYKGYQLENGKVYYQF